MGICKKAIKRMFKNDKWHILRGDTVKVLSGKDKGQVGTVQKVIRDERIPRVIVEGLNLVQALAAKQKFEFRCTIDTLRVVSSPQTLLISKSGIFTE